MELHRRGGVPAWVSCDGVFVLNILHGRGVYVPRAQYGIEGQLPFALFPGGLNLRPRPGCSNRPFRPFTPGSRTLYEAEVDNAPLADGLGVGKFMDLQSPTEVPTVQTFGSIAGFPRDWGQRIVLTWFSHVVVA